MYESDSTDNSTSNEISQHWQVEEAGAERVGRRCTPATHCMTEGIKGVSVREEGRAGWWWWGFGGGRGGGGGGCLTGGEV